MSNSNRWTGGHNVPPPPPKNTNYGNQPPPPPPKNNFVPPTQGVQPPLTGEKATVMINVEIMVEVAYDDDYNIMAELAKEKVANHLREGAGFYPFSVATTRVHLMPMVELKSKTIVHYAKTISRK